MPQGGTLRKKHVPERTCIVCRRKTRKGDLIRLVRVATGVVEIDIGGKLKGRGAYLCPFRDCWNVAVKSGRLEYSLKGKIDAEGRKGLSEYGQTLPERGV